MYISHIQNLATVVLTISLIILTTLFVAYRNKITLLLTALFSQRHLSQLQREGKLANKDLFVWVQIIILIVQALFLFIALQYFFPKIYNLLLPIYLYLILVIIVFIDYSIKRVANYFYMSLFEIQDEIPTYSLYKLFYSFTNSTLLLIILPLSLYTTNWKLIFLYIPVFLTTFLVTTFKLFTINKIKIKIFHFFIYFCTLEILPYLVVLKFLITYNK